jgi:hypothetical protein
VNRFLQSICGSVATDEARELCVPTVSGRAVSEPLEMKFRKYHGIPPAIPNRVALIATFSFRYNRQSMTPAAIGIKKAFVHRPTITHILRPHKYEFARFSKNKTMHKKVQHATGTANASFDTRITLEYTPGNSTTCVVTAHAAAELFRTVFASQKDPGTTNDAIKTEAIRSAVNTPAKDTNRRVNANTGATAR